MTTALKDFSDRLDVALNSAGMSRGDLAAACGVSASTVSRWKGKHTPQPSMLTTVAHVLGVRREWLVTGVEPMRPEGISYAPSMMIKEDTGAYRSGSRVPASMVQYIGLMTAILDEVRTGLRPVDDLEQVHALLDLAHPMQTRQKKIAG